MRNVLLIVVDTLRPDHLGCYGYSRNVSPNLDRLATRGIVLDNLWSASNFTAPAFTSLFTGQYPYQHGVFDFISKTKHSLVFDTIKANGAATGAVVTFRFFKNLLQDVWGDVEAVTETRSFDYSKDLPWAVTASALEWMERRDRDRPFCLFVHYDGPHMPYRLPDKFSKRFDSVDQSLVDPEVVGNLFPQDLEELSDQGGHATRSMFRMLEAVNWGRKRLDKATLPWIKDKYDASIFYNDAAIGGLLDGLSVSGLAEDTVVAVLSDHGEEFLEHGGISHSGIHLNEEIIRTVGIIRDPAFCPGKRRVPTPLSHIDIWPTLLSLSGVTELPAHWREREFSSLLRGESVVKFDGQPIFCQGKSKIAMRSGTKKMIRALPSPTLGRMARMRLWVKMMLRRELGTEIFDLAADSGELNNLFPDKALRRSLERLLDNYLATVQSGATPENYLAEIERKRIEKEMKDLGYM